MKKSLFNIINYINRASNYNVVKRLQILILFVFISPIIAQSQGFPRNTQNTLNPIVKLTKAERKWLKVHPNIKLGYTIGLEPLLIQDEEKALSGVLVDFLNDFNKRLGTNISIEVGNWKKILKKVEKKELAGVIVIDPGNADLRKLLKTKNHFTGYVVVYSYKEKPFKRPEDFIGKKVSFVDKFHFAEEITRPYAKNMNIVRTREHRRALELLYKGKVDYFVGLSFNSYLISKYMFHGVKPTHIFWDKPVKSVMGIRPDWPELVSILNKGIETFSENDFEKYMSKWVQIPAQKKKVLLTEQEKRWLKQHKIIRVGSDSAWAPIESLNSNNEFEGLSIDYLKKIEGMLGVRFKFINEDWQKLIELGKKKQIDMFTSVVRTSERENYLIFTKPYVRFPVGIFADEEIAYISDLQLISGRKVAVVEGYAIHDFIRNNYPDIELVLVKNSNEGLKLILDKKVFGYVDNIITTGNLINKKGYINIKLKGEVPFVYAQSMGIRKDWPVFKEIIQKTIDEIPGSERSSIYNKWVPLIYEKPADYSLVLKIIFGAFTLVSLFFIWNRSLKRQISKRTSDLMISEKKYRRIFESLSDGYLKVNMDRLIILANPVAAKILGYDDADELIQKNIVDDIYHGSQNKDQVRELLKMGPIENFEMAFKRKDGSKIIVEVNLSIVIENGIPGATEGTFKDITIRKESQREIACLVSTIHQSNDDIIITDTNGAIEYVNPAFEKITGYTQEEVKGQNPRMFKSGVHEQAFYKNLWDTIKKGNVWNGIITNTSKSGLLLEEHANIFPVFDENGIITNYAAVKRDVTNEKKIEENLRQAQKMEAIGTLAGGIAHDFNNILSAIIGYAEIVRSELPADSSLFKMQSHVLTASYRATELVKQILAFSRQGELKILPVRIQLIIKEALKLLRSSIPTTIEIKQDIDSKCKAVLADSTKIHQIIMNLCTNAYHAMREKGGVLGVSLKSVELDSDSLIHKLNLSSGQYLILEISDSGCGISPENQERIFEPYYTTKAKGEGTGLGLATVHGIVKTYKGDISVYSEVNKGTTFQIYLPVLKEDMKSSSEVEETSISTGTERILIVDDDTNLVQMNETILMQLGYKVTSFSNSLEAIKIFEKKQDEFDLVLTDMTMPEITGAELAKMLLEIRPDIPIILCTGYSDLIDAEQAKSIGIKDYIMKPVIRKDLANVIRKVLDGK